MNRQPILLAVILLTCSPAIAVAQEKPTEPTPEQVRRVDEAYARVGAKPGHSRNLHTGQTEYLYQLPAATTDDDLEKLPASPFPFGLSLTGTKVTNKGLSKLKGLDTLNNLKLDYGFLTDEGLSGLKSAGLVHALSQATGVKTARPNGPKDVRALDLFHEKKITAQGLRSLEGLTSLVELTVPEGQETDDMLRSLRKIGLLHAWRSATAKDGQRPDGPKDVVEVKLPSLKMTDAGLKELQDFVNLESLWLDSSAVTPAGLTNLKGLTKLNFLLLRDEQLTDEALVSLQKIGLLHAISSAGAKEGKHRPTKADEVTQLELANSHNVGDVGVGVLHDFKHLKKLTLHSTRVTSAGVEKLATFKELTELTLPGIKLTDQSVQVLAGLTELTTLSCLVTPEQLRQLKSLKKLTTLDCGNLTDDKLRALREAGLLHTLEQATTSFYDRPGKPENVSQFSLYLGIHRGVTAEGIKQLGVLKKLRELELGGGVFLTDDMLKALREANLLHTVKGVTVIERYRSIGGGQSVLDRWRPADMESVKLVELIQSNVTDEGLKELLPLKNLERLVIGSDKLTGSGFKHLAGLKSIRALELSGKKLSADGLGQLRQFPGLTELSVGSCNLSTDAIKALVSLEKLTVLKMEYVRLNEEGARELTRFKNAPAIRLSLESLSAPAPVLKGLQGVKNLTSLKVFSEIPAGSIKELVTLTSLTSLNLGSTHVTDDVLKQLPALKNLKWLEFQGGHASKEAIREFRAAMPGCQVYVEE